MSVIWFIQLYTHALRFTPMEESAEEYVSVNFSV